MKRNMAALVIGNANYPDGADLKNPVNDAEDMAEKLSSYGFHTIKAIDATRLQMDVKLTEFAELLKTSEVGLFFFAGHGMQIHEENYLIAIDTNTKSELFAKHSSMPLKLVIDTMDDSKDTATKIIMLDACRNNPWERSWKRTVVGRGLASVYAPKGTIIGFATSPGQLASDGNGRNGAYTSALLQHIDEPDLPIETMFKQVRNTVAAETGGDQTTWEHTSLSGNFFFNSSLGKTITDYPETSLADELFIIDTSKPSHKIIQGLKSHHWFKQNPSMGELTPATVTKMHESNLFVLGRNINQAACGTAHEAESFIKSFATITAEYPKEKSKAILDGMLFEVFFDKHAELRREIKHEYFNQLFDLQKYAEFKDSFEFIAQALDASGSQFHVLPGKGHELAVTVNTTAVRDDVNAVATVYIDGRNVLRAVDPDYAEDDPAKRHHFGTTSAEVVDLLTRELMVPNRLLKVAFVPPEAVKKTVCFPRGYTVRKR